LYFRHVLSTNFLKTNALKNYRFYLYTLLVLIAFSVAATFLGVNALSKSHTIQILENEIQSAEQQAKDIARMAEKAFQSSISEVEIAQSIQRAIDGSDKKNVFLSVFDWSEKLISHPNVTLVGSIQGKSSGMKLNMDQVPTGEELFDYISSVDRSTSDPSEIFYIAQIQGLGWIIGAHINKDNIHSMKSSWDNKAYLVFFVVMLMIVLIVMGIIRSITSYYEAQLSLKSSKIEDGVLNLSKLNTSLENYQNKLGELTTLKTTETVEVEVTKEKEKQRILTYVRNELMPIATEDIGYIYVENTITYVVRKDGKRSTTSESLDQIYSYLDEKSFFRANRQIIVAISAIDKIIKFGNSKLKIQVSPASEIDIIIGKNKAAAFKQWLDL
jgi:DNA-binding LytR/AlgR family response regulator